MTIDGADAGAEVAGATLRNAAVAPLLEVEDLRVHFASKHGVVHAVDGVSLTIDPGETLGLVGETGSGKSVTARSLLQLNASPPAIAAGGTALFRPRRQCPACSGAGCERCGGSGRSPRSCPRCDGAGCVACGGTGHETVDLLTLSDRALRDIRGNHIAMVFQDPGKALNPALPIRRQLAEVFTEHRSDELLRDVGLDPREAHVLFQRDAHGRSRRLERAVLSLPPFRARHHRLQRVLDDRIAQALADTRIPNPRKVMQRYPHELSGGMKQRVMIAQALAADPELLIADEPTTALDVTIQARILDLLADLQARHKMAVLYISHDLSLVRGISDRVAVMYAGQLVEAGRAMDVFERPMHPYTRGLLGALPATAQRRGTLVAIEGTVPELIDPVECCRFHTRCPHAAAVCTRRTPALRGGDGRPHPAACFLYDDADEIGEVADAMPSARLDPERAV